MLELGVKHYILTKITAMQRKDKISEQFEFIHCWTEETAHATLTNYWLLC